VLGSSFNTVTQKLKETQKERKNLTNLNQLCSSSRWIFRIFFSCFLSAYFSIIQFFVYVSFLKVSHDQLSLEKGVLTEAKRMNESVVLVFSIDCAEHCPEKEKKKKKGEAKKKIT